MPTIWILPLKCDAQELKLYPVTSSLHIPLFKMTCLKWNGRHCLLSVCCSSSLLVCVLQCKGMHRLCRKYIKSSSLSVQLLCAKRSSWSWGRYCMLCAALHTTFTIALIRSSSCLLSHCNCFKSIPCFS